MRNFRVKWVDHSGVIVTSAVAYEKHLAENRMQMLEDSGYTQVEVIEEDPILSAKRRSAS